MVIAALLLKLAVNESVTLSVSLSRLNVLPLSSTVAQCMCCHQLSNEAPVKAGKGWLVISDQRPANQHAYLKVKGEVKGFFSLKVLLQLNTFLTKSVQLSDLSSVR